MSFSRPCKPCNCGSGLMRYDLTDAAGIFCCYVCEECEDQKKKKFNPDIFGRNSRYAMSGDEEQLEIDYDF